MNSNFDSSKGELRRCNVSTGMGNKSYVTKEVKGEYFKALVDNRKKKIQAIIQDATLFQHLANLENMNLLYQ